MRGNNLLNRSVHDPAMSIRHLDSLFDPASVAVIGASARPGSLGATVWRNLHQGQGQNRYRGTVGTGSRGLSHVAPT